jgi:hypothetical protein
VLLLWLIVFKPVFMVSRDYILCPQVDEANEESASAEEKKDDAAPGTSCVAAIPMHSLHDCPCTVINKEIFGIFFVYVLYSTLLHLPHLRFHCVGRCWDRTQDGCNFGIGSQKL